VQTFISFARVAKTVPNTKKTSKKTCERFDRFAPAVISLEKRCKPHGKKYRVLERSGALLERVFNGTVFAGVA